ncbi:unnamed protein product [Ceratitis capitata]|uniref:(Mediterranean fruit fly) hypothetical protein n=1 Tax=Ceratitis capitata TaxID=7213 RepID=A0A811VGB1_CERCA|nr:unnamed protein product [Ceratitis capitata]
MPNNCRNRNSCLLPRQAWKEEGEKNATESGGKTREWKICSKRGEMVVIIIGGTRDNNTVPLPTETTTTTTKTVKTTTPLTIAKIIKKASTSTVNAAVAVAAAAAASRSRGNLGECEAGCERQCRNSDEFKGEDGTHLNEQSNERLSNRRTLRVEKRDVPAKRLTDEMPV